MRGCGKSNTIVWIGLYIHHVVPPFPHVNQEEDSRLQRLLGDVNHDIVDEAMKALTTGEVEGLG